MIEGATSKNLNGGNLIVYYAPAGSPPELLRIKEENGVVKKIHLKDYEKQNSADPDVMRSVIGEVVSQYPADSYGLVLWSHGTAWLPSIWQRDCQMIYLILSCSMPATWQASNALMSLETKLNIS